MPGLMGIAAEPPAAADGRTGATSSGGGRSEGAPIGGWTSEGAKQDSAHASGQCGAASTADADNDPPPPGNDHVEEADQDEDAAPQPSSSLGNYPEFHLVPLPGYATTAEQNTKNAQPKYALALQQALWPLPLPMNIPQQ